MAIRPTYIEAPAGFPPAHYGLLSTFAPKPLPDHGALAGVEYDLDYCGVARPWTPPPCGAPEDLGTVSVSVDDAATATLTLTGEPSGSDYTIQWGDGDAEGNVDPNGATHTYAAAGSYTVVIGNTSGYQAVVEVTVADTAASGPFAADAVGTKVSDDGVEQAVGAPIVIYHLFSCRLVGGVDLAARAATALDSGASRAIEQGFGDILGNEALDVTPGGTPVAAAVGLALLEQEGGAAYGGQRVIHADNAVVTSLISKSLVVQVGDHLETLLGSLVVSGPGYAASSGPSAPAAGAHWMYATGAVHIWVDETIKPPMVIDNPATGVYDNEARVLAERTYVPTFECFARAVEVTLEA